MPVGRAHTMPFGAALLPGGGTRFRLWAPASAQVELELHEGPECHDTIQCHDMRSVADGWHELTVASAAAGARYRFATYTDDRRRWLVPDPASRFNPDGVHLPSAVVDPRAYRWSDSEWRGRPWTEAVLYELHVGTFTDDGTFAAAQGRLGDLAALGITALQLMPLAAFAGRRNWGYDGVLIYAPAASYGTPDELKSFIDAAHRHGLMVILDAVYNHFGPDGNYLHVYCPQFFDRTHSTPWGAAINLAGEHCATVRSFLVHNALYWVEEYGFDGLRLDAVHAFRDPSSPDIVQQIATALRDGPGARRQVHLIVENSANQAGYLALDAGGRPLCATAQWNDDLHHALHVLTSGESGGYYADFASTPLQHLGRALAEGFAYQGEYSGYRARPRGEASSHLPAWSFIGFLQNHDMIGNRACGERIHQLSDECVLEAAYACLLLAPDIPMLFMGEEFAASSPFLFFCDFGPELAEAVTRGRRREYRRYGKLPDGLEFPEPNAPGTFQASKLHWQQRNQSPHRERLALVRELLSLRCRYLAPLLPQLLPGGRYQYDNSSLSVEWSFQSGDRWYLAACFGAESDASALVAAEIVYSCRTRYLDGRRLRIERGGVVVACQRSPREPASP
jgi:maltooligosyltrehalose trehalohydrolase